MSFRINDKEVFYKIPEIEEFKEDYRILKPYYKRLNEYRALNVKNKVVVDIGAWIGDYSIFFALRGAAKVLAIEPHPYSYQLLKHNIYLNKMSHVIQPINAAVSSSRGIAKIPLEVSDSSGKSLDSMSIGNCMLRGDCIYVDVPVVTLADINSKVLELVNKSNKSSKYRGIVLKMDCEGCEYDVLLKSDAQDIRLYNEIVFEFHRDPEPLKQVLNKIGFKANVIRVYNPNLGIIYAKRI